MLNVSNNEVPCEVFILCCRCFDTDRTVGKKMVQQKADTSASPFNILVLCQDKNEMKNSLALINFSNGLPKLIWLLA